MRRLTKFSYSNKLKFEWEQSTGQGWETCGLASIEQADPDLQKAYDRFKFVVKHIADIKDDLLKAIETIAIKSITISRDKHTDEREVKIRAEYYSKTAHNSITIITPKLNELLFDGPINGEPFPRLIDDLEGECFKYIDGCRAQQVLQFEMAAELAEEARTEAE